MKRILTLALLLVCWTAFGGAGINETNVVPNLRVINNANLNSLVQVAVPLSGTDIDPTTGGIFSKSLSADTVFTFSNLANGQRWLVILTNGASWTVTWPTVTWLGGSAPVMDTGAGTVNVFTFLRQSGVTFGDVSQKSNTQLDTLGAGITGIVAGTGSTYQAATAGTGIAIGGTTIYATNVVENAILLSDNTTNDVSITAHGFVPKAPNVAAQYLNGTGAWTALPVAYGAACSDETTALTASTAKVTFRMPHAMTVTAVRASLTTAQASGNIFTVDINEGGASILGTKITIDNTELTSTTAVDAPTISDSALADDASITVDIDQIGDGTAKGLKIWIIGTR